MLLSKLPEYIYHGTNWPSEVSPHFVGDLPGQTEEGCGMIMLPGDASVEYFSSPTSPVSMFKPLVRFIIRTKTYQKGADWCQAIHQNLHRYHDDQLEQVLSVGAIMALGRTPEKLYEFQMTFRTTLQESE